jgi:hypothetical protein
VAEEMQVYIFDSVEPTHDYVTFPVGSTVGRVSCRECDGTGWWGYGPTEAEDGECVPCKGTGRVWVGIA